MAGVVASSILAPLVLVLNTAAIASANTAACVDSVVHNLTGTKRRIRFDAVDDKENRQERENNKKNRVSGDFVYKSTAAVRATGKDPPRVELKKQTQSERRLKAVAYYNDARAKGKSVASSREFASQQTGYATKYVRNLVKKARTQGLDEACHDRRPGSGAPSKMSPAKQKILEDFSEENGGMFTNADAVVALAKKGKHVVKETIRRFIVAPILLGDANISETSTFEHWNPRRRDESSAFEAVRSSFCNAFKPALSFYKACTNLYPIAETPASNDNIWLPAGRALVDAGVASLPASVVEDLRSRSLSWVNERSLRTKTFTHASTELFSDHCAIYADLALQPGGEMPNVGAREHAAALPDTAQDA
ncbi:hypothetical protein RI054_44g153360 [Pseudoscourfieldia marina]